MFTVIYHSLLIGAALFVPIPFLDDRLATFLWKHMVSDLAKSHKRNLTNEHILTLSYQARFSLADGCFSIAKRIFRELSQEILFFLEWSKAINLSADAYYSGYLLNELFAYEGFDPAKVGQYAVALQKAKQGTNMKLMQGVFRGNFRSGKGVLTSIVKWLTGIATDYLKDLRRRGIKRRNDPAFDKNMGGFFEQNKAKLESLINQLKTHFDEGLGKLPAQHFDELRNRMFEELRLHKNL